MIFEVTSEVQRKYTDLLVGLRLIDSYDRIEGGVTELLVTNLAPEVMDWTLAQYLHVGAREGEMVLRVDPSLLASLPESAAAALDGLGIRIEPA